MNMISKAAHRKGNELESWTIPLVYVLVTLVFGMLLPRFEHYILPNAVSTMSASAAMGICGAVASGMIALTGVVFFLAFVMVQGSSVGRAPLVSAAMW